MPDPTPSAEAIDVLRLLKANHNVVIGGAPATGKSILLGQVADTFCRFGPPPHLPNAPIPIPPGIAGPIPDWMPSPGRQQRRAFKTSFHQGTKFRDWLRGLIPVPGTGGVAFRVSRGIFWDAIEFARGDGAAALVVIDEVNRGPAVQIFGDTLVALEVDKRLDESGNVTPTTTPVLVMSDSGDLEAVPLPFHLYLVAAMNRADTSVEPLDVAFLRRWQPYNLAPQPEKASAWLGLTSTNGLLPASASTRDDALRALFESWVKVNHRITLLRGSEYQLGHGVLMRPDGPPGTTVDEALVYAQGVWSKIREHVNELFFGDVRTIAAILSADRAGSPFELRTGIFADTPTQELTGPDHPDALDLYRLLRAIALDT
jgi:5-methylcytosine-specific restriction enzyme B